jgi:hypothetical protein
MLGLILLAGHRHHRRRHRVRLLVVAAGPADRLGLLLHLLARVDARVAGELVRAAEALLAGGVRALEGLLAGVGADVAGLVLEAGEGAAAGGVWAFVGAGHWALAVAPRRREIARDRVLGVCDVMWVLARYVRVTLPQR